MVDREYEQDSNARQQGDAFHTWLRAHCILLADGDEVEETKLMALSLMPCRQVCLFKSMTAYGSHFRVLLEEGGRAQHVTFDSGVAKLQTQREGDNCSDQGGVVDMLRVNILKNILMLNYVGINVVLMVVSWVAKDIESSPRLRWDLRGFWSANMTATPRYTKQPYIFPSLALHVRTLCPETLLQSFPWRGGCRGCPHLSGDMTCASVLCGRQSNAKMERSAKEGGKW